MSYVVGGIGTGKFHDHMSSMHTVQVSKMQLIRASESTNVGNVGLVLPTCMICIWTLQCIFQAQ